MSRVSIAPRDRWRWFLVGLFVAAVAWRLIVLGRLSHTPLLDYLSADAEVYWGWASEIRSGHWAPDHPFFLGPLYAYWLAMVRTLVGDDIHRVLLLQSVLGASAVVLVTEATRMIATPRAAAAIGIALAGYAMTLYFDHLVLMENLLFFLMSLALWLIVRDGRRSPILVGAVVVALALGRPTAILLLVPYGVHLAMRPRRLQALAGLLAVPLAITVASGTYHLRVAEAWIPFTYSGGYNFYMGNGPEANGTYVPFADEYIPSRAATDEFRGGAGGDGRSYLSHTQGLRLSAGASSRYWFRQAMTHVRAEPLRTVRLFALKLGLLANHRELPQLSDAEAYDRIAGPLGWPSRIVFGCLAVLGLLGVSVAWRRGRLHRVIVGALAALLVGTATFFVVDRYRVHLIPPLALLAGLGITHVGTVWRARDVRRVLATASVSALACTIVFMPLIPHSRAMAEWSYASTMGEAWLAKGEPNRAVPWFERAVGIDRGGELPASATTSARLSRAGIYENLGIAYALLGDDKRAASVLANAVELAPRSPSTRARYAERLAMTGAWAAAKSQFRAAGISSQEAAEALVQRAVHRAHGDVTETRRYLEAAAGILPSYERAIIPLVRLDLAEGRLDSARAGLRRADANGVDVHLVRAHLAWIKAAQGDSAGSRRLWISIPVDVRANDPRIAATLAELRAAMGAERRRSASVDAGRESPRRDR